MDKQACNSGCEQNSYCGKQNGLGNDRLCLFDIAAEAAVKHDENKADRTDQLTELIIIERYFKDTVYPKAHAQQDKRKKGRDAQFIDETAG